MTVSRLDDRGRDRFSAGAVLRYTSRFATVGSAHAAFWPVVVIVGGMAVARALYYTYGELGYYGETLSTYVHYVDPQLLQHDLVDSVLHLHSQPPLYNLFLGVVLKVFPVHHDLAFNTFSIVLGVGLVLSMFRLQLAFGVDRRLAVVVALLFGVSPVTALFENFLFPTYLVAALLTVAALALHRYVTDGRARYAILFFALLATIVLARGFYQPFWFLVPLVAVLGAMPHMRRRTLMAAAGPAALLVASSVLSYVEFGSPFSGQIYRDLNRMHMTTWRLPSETVERLIDAGTISPINRFDPYEAKGSVYVPYVTPPASTGVAVLDQQFKSTGAINWHSLWFKEIAEQYERDAGVVSRQFPQLYRSAVKENLVRFLALPADQSDPYLRMRADHPMREVVRAWDVVFAGQRRYGGAAFFSLVALPAAILFGLTVVRRVFFRLGRSARAAGPTKADGVTVLFILYNVLYIGAVGVVFSSGDQSRYRFEAMPLVCVLLAMLVGSAWHARRTRRGRSARA